MMKISLRIIGVLISTALLAVFLTACGSGGGGGDGNNAPVAIAGSAQNVLIGSVVTLDGSDSSDVDGDSLTYSWTLTEKPTGSTAVMSDSTVVDPSFTADMDGFYIVSLTVNDGAVDSTADSVTITASSITFTDYFPLNDCTSTIEWTFGSNIGQQYPVTIGGTEIIPYTSGPITGVKMTGMLGEPTASTIWFNDGVSVKFLRYNDYYVSTDCTLTAHPSEWSFSIMHNGMIIDQTGTHYQVNKNDFSDCTAISNQQLLINIKDVTVQGTLYQNAVIWYQLDLNYPFTSLDFSGKDADLGITLPTGSDTGGYSVTNFDIYGFGTGWIANGDVNADSGLLVELSERVANSCP